MEWAMRLNKFCSPEPAFRFFCSYYRFLMQTPPHCGRVLDRASYCSFGFPFGQGFLILFGLQKSYWEWDRCLDRYRRFATSCQWYKVHFVSLFVEGMACGNLD